MALDMGMPLLANIIMTGALVGAGLLPIDKDRFKDRFRMNFKKEQLALNVKAFEMGIAEITQSTN
jgi:Pyruvate/2-oxoacid:ferredoxin oxidoreductase gamma subunit